MYNLKERYEQYKIARANGCSPVDALELCRLWEKLEKELYF